MRFRLATLAIAFVVSHAAAQVRDVRVMSSGVGAANIATRVRGGETVDVLFLSASIMDDMIMVSIS